MVISQKKRTHLRLFEKNKAEHGRDEEIHQKREERSPVLTSLWCSWYSPM